MTTARFNLLLGLVLGGVLISASHVSDLFVSRLIAFVALTIVALYLVTHESEVRR